jgi:hypothetical protein
MIVVGIAWGCLRSAQSALSNGGIKIQAARRFFVLSPGGRTIFSQIYTIQHCSFGSAAGHKSRVAEAGPPGRRRPGHRLDLYSGDHSSAAVSQAQ